MQLLDLWSQNHTLNDHNCMKDHVCLIFKMNITLDALTRLEFTTLGLCIKILSGSGGWSMTGNRD